MTDSSTPIPSGEPATEPWAKNDPHSANIEWRASPSTGSIQWRGEWSQGVVQESWTGDLGKWVPTSARVALWAALASRASRGVPEVVEPPKAIRSGPPTKEEIAFARELFGDRPDADGTDFAHPAWWRGNDRGVAATVEALNKILDSGRDGGTFGYRPLEELANRIAALRYPAAIPEVLVSTNEGLVNAKQKASDKPLVSESRELTSRNRCEKRSMPPAPVPNLPLQ